MTPPRDSKTRLGEMLRLYRTIENVGVRDMGADIGISAATVSRIERGEGFDVTTLLRLLTWLLEKR